jgi:fructokinase
MECKPITIFGEVLFDRFPDGVKVLGGAPFNVAWHLQAFGQMPQFISCVGNDISGQQIRNAMQSWGMTHDLLQLATSHPTGQVDVSFTDGEPAYDIVADQSYDHIALPTSDNLNRTGILYHGTLALRSLPSSQTLTAIKSRHLGKIFIDVNLRKPWWQKAEVSRLIQDADWLKLNQDELKALTGDSDTTQTTMKDFLATYGLEGMILTCGKDGAFALDNNGHFHLVSPCATNQVVDTVGAGDAFTAVILLGLNLGWELGLAMVRAQSFASAITCVNGAIVNQPSFYRHFLNAWGLEGVLRLS